MMLLLRACWYVYDWSLRLYPRELCDEFGPDIREMFRQQTLESWECEGWPGLAPVLWCGVKEFYTEALCQRASSPAVIATASSLVCTSATFLCLLWALGNPLEVKAVGDRVHQILWDGGRPRPASSFRRPVIRTSGARPSSSATAGTARQ